MSPSTPDSPHRADRPRRSEPGQRPEPPPGPEPPRRAEPPPRVRRLYAWLLLAYPKGIRDEYGEEMTRVFLDLWRDRADSGRRFARVELWARPLRDVAVNAVLAWLGRSPDLYRRRPGSAADRNDRGTGEAESSTGSGAPSRGPRRSSDMRGSGPETGGGRGAAPEAGRPWTERLLHETIRDLRHALRTTRNSPGFTAAVVSILALGIGANTAIFSVVNGVLLQPLPYPEPDRLVQIWTEFPEQGLSDFPASRAEFTDYRRESRLFEEMAAYWPTSAILTGEGEPSELRVAAATAGIWSILGTRSTVGRLFTEDEDRPGRADVVVLSHGLWRRRFGADPDVLGRRIRLDDRPYTVVGVTGPGARLPRFSIDAWVPLAIDPAVVEENRSGHLLGVIGRVDPGVDLADVQTEMSVVVERWRREYDHAHPFSVRSLREQVVGDVDTPLMILLTAVGAVLLVACANVAGLFAARAERRRGEIAIRSALGASRGRLLRQLLTESLVLAALGGGLGLVLAVFGTDALLTLEPGDVPRLHEIRLDAAVLAFTLVASLSTGVGFGLAPVLRTARRGSRHATLREGYRRGRTSGTPRRGFQRGLVLGQVTLAVVLTVGAVLLVRSFARLTGVDPGFHTDGVLTAELTLPAARYETSRDVTSLYRRLVDRVETLPGVRSVGLVRSLPLADQPFVESFLKEGETFDVTHWRRLDYQIVTPGYFTTLGIPVVDGRGLTAGDGPESRRVVLVNETLARLHFADDDPVGERIRILAAADNEEPFEIVGVVGDVKHAGLDEEVPPQAFLPVAQAAGYSLATSRSTTLTIRTDGTPENLVEPVRSTVWELDPDLAPSGFRTMERVVEESVSRPRFLTLLLSLFSGVAVLLSVVGLYGVVAYGVAGRTRELGLRMALGASRADLLRMVVRQGMAPALGGLGLGVVAALALSDLLASQLFGIQPREPTTYLAVAALLAFVTALASWLPARRAIRVDPMEALRTE